MSQFQSRIAVTQWWRGSRIVQVGKALIFATLLGCLEPVLTITALLSHRPPFVMPLHQKDQADRAKRAFAGGEASDHLALLEAHQQWEREERRGGGFDFARRHYLSAPTLRMVSKIKSQYRELLRDASLLPENEQFADRNSGDWSIVKAALCAGLYPNLVRLSGGERPKFFTAEHGTVKLHPGSVNDKVV